MKDVDGAGTEDLHRWPNATATPRHATMTMSKERVRVSVSEERESWHLRGLSFVLYATNEY